MCNDCIDKLELTSKEVSVVDECAARVGIRPGQIRTVCAWCKLVIKEATEQPVHVSHGMCSDCLERHYPEVARKLKGE